ncbi:MAG TPA: hypothetical protein V6C81_10380 [Planktothrix sp.]|jgi:hypothetical protein
MRAVINVLLLSALALSSSTNVGAFAKPNDSFDGMIIELQNDPIGRMTWYLSPKGAKTISPIAAMIATPQVGHLIAYNPDTKKYFLTADIKAMRHAMENFATVVNRKKYHWTKWQLVGQETISGIKCKHLRRTLASPPEDKGKGLTSSFIDDAWVSTLDDRKSYQQYLNPLTSIFSSDMPYASVAMKRISVWNVYQGGKLVKTDPKDEVRVLSVKKVKFTPDEFAVPKGCKQVSTLAEVMPDDMTFGFPR